MDVDVFVVSLTGWSLQPKGLRSGLATDEQKESGCDREIEEGR
jgi:hypothetical protein